MVVRETLISKVGPDFNCPGYIRSESSPWTPQFLLTSDLSFRLSTRTESQKLIAMAPIIQKPAPFFKKTAVVDGVFEEVSLDQYKGKWVLLAFIPLAFTFVCPTEIIAYSEAAKQFAEEGAQVLFASTDSEYSLLAWTNVARQDGGLGPVNIPLLADTNHTLSKDYGVLIEEEGVALRGIFLIDPKGVLRQITINDLPVGRSVEESLRLLKAFKFTDEHGEVCPANWQPGADTIKPEVDASKEFFSKSK